MVRTGSRIAVIVAVAAAAGAALLAGCGGENAESARVTAAPSATRAAVDATASSTPAPSAPAVTAAPEPTANASAPSPAAAAASPTAVAPQPTATPPPPAPTGATVTIAAQDVRFVPGSASAPLGAHVTVIFNNDDAGVAHNLVLYGPDRTRLGGTDVFTGPGTQQFSFDAVAPGPYAYACTVHRAMSGTLTVE